MTVPTSAADSPASAVLHLVRSGRATSRAEVARETGVSATTAAARVEELIERGFLEETVAERSGGGRPPRRLRMRAAAGVVAAVALGEHHAAVGLVDAGGGLLVEERLPLDIGAGPETVLRTVAERVGGLLDAEVADGAPLRAVCLGIPGPVDARTGRVVSPARMPGWNGADVRGLTERLLPAPVPVLVENDANLMALGEHAAAGADVDHLVFVKVGSGIGCGIVAGGSLHRGGRGFAGDISHVTVPDAPPVPCSCGRTGCLDAVASGAALVDQLRRAGVPVDGTDALLDLARDAHPQTTQLLRGAGMTTGTVLSVIVNFFNPDRLVVGGFLSLAEAFVAGVRSAVYSQCPPMITDGLELGVSRVGQRAAVLGAGHAALDLAFSGAVLEATS
jgi:predicted NBD/HSP70 family sugar kinase